jgi:hypothetical protein
MKLLPRPAIAALLSSLLTAASAQSDSAVQRCEGRDGRVTYSNTQCPDGTAPVRKVKTDPPVSAEARNAARDRAQRDSAAVLQIEQQRAQQQARERKQAEQRAAAQAKAGERCERARRELARAEAARAELRQRPAPAARTTRAEQDVARREAQVADACAS